MRAREQQAFALSIWSDSWALWHTYHKSSEQQFQIYIVKFRGRLLRSSSLVKVDGLANIGLDCGVTVGFTVRQWAVPAKCALLSRALCCKAVG